MVTGPEETGKSRSSIGMNSLCNLLCQLIPSLLGLLSVPVLIRSMGSDRFGVVTIVWVIIGYFSLFDLGLGRALTQVVAEKLGKNEGDDIPSLFWTANVAVVLLSLCATVLLLLMAPYLVHGVLKVGLELQKETMVSFRIVTICLPFVIVTSMLNGYLSAYHRFDLINAVRLPMGLYSFGAPLLALPYSNSLVPVVAILSTGRVITFLLLLYLCLRISPELRRKVAFTPSLMVPLFRFGGWMTVSNLISPFMVYFDRLFISSMLSVAAVAYYTTPFELVTRLSIVPNSIIAVLFPTFASNYVTNIGYAADVFSRAVKYLLLILFPIVLAIVTGAHQLMAFWIGAGFADNSYRALQYLAIGVFVNCVALIPCSFLQGIGKPQISAKFHVAELVVYTPMLWWLVKHQGIGGAACAWLVRMTIDAALLLAVSHHLCRPNRLLPAPLIAVMLFSWFSLLLVTWVESGWIRCCCSFLSLVIVESVLLFKLTDVLERRGMLRNLLPLP